MTPGETSVPHAGAGRAQNTVTDSGNATADHDGIAISGIVSIETHHHPPVRGAVLTLLLLIVLGLCGGLLWRTFEVSQGLVGRLSTHLATRPTLPELYQADAPGAECDKGGARWTLLEGKVTCTGQRALYQDASVSFDWPGRAFPPAYEITLHADALGPTSCIGILMRDKYGVSACASGGVQILRLEPRATVTAGKPTRTFTRAQITVRVEEQKLTVTVFTFDSNQVITLTVDDDYGSGDVLAILVSSPDDKPAERATATLHGFQYRAIS
ncbi:hypothetical protein GA0070616_5456 [Micromonospora nigra]|uniref:Uncharacterized protein n=1 Tax=Micromonospora nigra TaxID=145857 RepID=A0A1C6T3G0_9ACTN|nr:hypothetical protein [Micromonospora nigra]SCL36318.1 hypothetical protein GA0070616_5456 [Micromonospora nigra]